MKRRLHNNTTEIEGNNFVGAVASFPDHHLDSNNGAVEAAPSHHRQLPGSSSNNNNAPLFLFTPPPQKRARYDGGGTGTATTMMTTTSITTTDHSSQQQQQHDDGMVESPMPISGVDNDKDTQVAGNNTRKETPAPWWKQQQQNHHQSRNRNKMAPLSSLPRTDEMKDCICFVCQKELTPQPSQKEVTAASKTTISTTQNRNSILNYWNFSQQHKQDGPNNDVSAVVHHSSLHQQPAKQLFHNSSTISENHDHSSSCGIACSYCERYVCRRTDDNTDNNNNCSQKCESCQQTFCLFCVTTDYHRHGDERILCLECQREEQRTTDNHHHHQEDGMNLG